MGKGGGVAGKGERTREQILQTYVALLATTPYDKVSVRALCGALGIVRSTFYAHFSDIYEVIQTVEDGLISAFEQVDRSLGEAALPAPRTQLNLVEGLERSIETEWGFAIYPSQGFEAWFDCLEQHWDELRAMLGPNGDPYFEAKFRRGLERHVTLLMDEDRMPNDEMRRGFTEAYVEVHMLLVRNWMLHEKTSLNRDFVTMIINTMRVGGNVIGHYTGTRRLWHPEPES